MLPALKLNRYSDKLHALRAHGEAHGLHLAEDAPDLGDSADRASRQTEATVTIGLATHEAMLRKEIDDALDRIEAGTFGVCEGCHAVIGMRRLNAIPYTRYCVRCERRVEQEETH